MYVYIPFGEHNTPACSYSSQLNAILSPPPPSATTNKIKDTQIPFFDRNFAQNKQRTLIVDIAILFKPY